MGKFISNHNTRVNKDEWYLVLSVLSDDRMEWIENTAIGNWTITDLHSNKFVFNYGFELESDSVLFKLTWL